MHLQLSKKGGDIMRSSSIFNLDFYREDKKEHGSRLSKKRMKIKIGFCVIENLIDFVYRIIQTIPKPYNQKIINLYFRAYEYYARIFTCRDTRNFSRSSKLAICPL